MIGSLPPLASLDAAQRRQYISIRDFCNRYRGSFEEFTIQKVLAKTATPSRSFFSMIWKLRMGNDIGALTDLKDALAMLDLTDSTLEQAIKNITGEQPEKEQPKETEKPVSEEKPKESNPDVVKSKLQKGYNDKQKACLAIVDVLGGFDGNARRDIITAVEKFVELV